MYQTVTFQWQMWDAAYNGHMMTTSISNFLIMFTEFLNLIEMQSTIMHAQVPSNKTQVPSNKTCVSLGTTTWYCLKCWTPPNNTDQQQQL